MVSRFLPATLCFLPLLAIAQVSAVPGPRMPPDYRGVQTFVPGIFLTPIPNAPFTASVEIITHQKLPDGTEVVRTTTNHIARDSAGRIYNERRMMVPTTFKGESRLLSAHIFDPNNLLNIFYDPATHLARESTLRRLPTPSPNAVPVRQTSHDAAYKEVELGEQSIDGTTLRGFEKQRILSAETSGTGQPVTVTDQYWYSSDLGVYLIIRHNDPRTGEQIVAVTHIDRHEPPAVQFTVPAAYKIVDETPPPQ
jgi:hypothetical protein